MTLLSRITTRKNRRLAVCLAMLGLLLATAAIESWHHHDSSSAAPCQICHVAHAPVLPAAAVTQLPAPAKSFMRPRTLIEAQSLTPIRLDAPPRAPPL